MKQGIKVVVTFFEESVRVKMQRDMAEDKRDDYPRCTDTLVIPNSAEFKELLKVKDIDCAVYAKAALARKVAARKKAAEEREEAEERKAEALKRVVAQHKAALEIATDRVSACGRYRTSDPRVSFVKQGRWYTCDVRAEAESQQRHDGAAQPAAQPAAPTVTNLETMLRNILMSAVTDVEEYEIVHSVQIDNWKNYDRKGTRPGEDVLKALMERRDDKYSTQHADMSPTSYWFSNSDTDASLTAAAEMSSTINKTMSRDNNEQVMSNKRSFEGAFKQ
jgi:hypothetical protein